MRALTAAFLPALLLLGASSLYGQRSPITRRAPQPQAPVVAPPSQPTPQMRVQTPYRQNNVGVGQNVLRSGRQHQHDHGHSHYGYGGNHFNGGYGYGYGGGGYYGGFSVGGPGVGLNQYVGPSHWGPLINPPLYAFPPYGGFGYGMNFGYAPSYGYGTAFSPGPALNNQLMQDAYNNDWTRLSAEMAARAMRDVADPRQTAQAIPVPSSPEVKIKSLRYQSQGDEAFRNQEYNRAFERYRLAGVTAKDNGSAWVRAGYALVALGKYSQAAEHFKRGLAADPSIAVTGPAPEELYGDHLLAWNSHLGGATLWVREDVRDSERVFLLGTLLYFKGDSRAPEFLERAYQLSGGREEAVLALLNPPKLEAAVVEDQNAPIEEAPGEPDIEALLDQSGEGPVLSAPNVPLNEGEPLLKTEGEPQSVAPANPPSKSVRPPGWTPQFPLPSEQRRDEAGDAVPPLPAPEEN